MTDVQQKIRLEDHTDRTPPNESENETKNSNMSSEEQKKDEPQASTGDNPLGLTPDAPEKKAWYEQPGGLGNSAGEKVQGALSPVGKPLGKGLETVAKPVGGLVEPLVGGLMKTGEAFGEQAGVGFGNKDGGPKAAQDAEGQRLKEGLGNRLQKADNPLGL